jgi:uncharacterized membrane protein
MNNQARYDFVDVLRGSAIAMMFVYHFSYDLNMLGFARLDFYHNPFWLNFRTVIVSTFLGVVGASLYLAHRHRLRVRPYTRRILILMLSAALVSVVTYVMFKERWVFFGILHFIAVASLLALPFIRLYWINLIVGIAVILIGSFYSHPAFNQDALQWIGLMTHKPATEDYVPLLPWFGVVLCGIFAGKLVYQAQYFPLLVRWQGRSKAARVLRLGGRHSLVIYLVHQPVFIGVLTAAKKLLG